jgi:hypothetical protein
MLLTIGGWVGLRKENQHILPASGWVVALGKEWVKEWFHLYERFPITIRRFTSTLSRLCTRSASACTLAGLPATRRQPFSAAFYCTCPKSCAAQNKM